MNFTTSPHLLHLPTRRTLPAFGLGGSGGKHFLFIFPPLISLRSWVHGRSSDIEEDGSVVDERYVDIVHSSVAALTDHDPDELLVLEVARGVSAGSEHLPQLLFQ